VLDGSKSLDDAYDEVRMRDGIADCQFDAHRWTAQCAPPLLTERHQCVLRQLSATTGPKQKWIHGLS
jgi:hypothetical protein